MARRRELADGGNSGHVIFDSPANADWPLAYIAQAVRSGEGMAYSFDMIAGTTAPASSAVHAVAEMLQRDLVRHLDARAIPVGWVREASLTVEIGSSTPRAVAPVRCQVRIVDDRGTVHTSTRRGQTRIPARSTPSALRRRLRRWFGA